MRLVNVNRPLRQACCSVTSISNKVEDNKVATIFVNNFRYYIENSFRHAIRDVIFIARLIDRIYEGIFAQSRKNTRKKISFENEQQWFLKGGVTFFNEVLLNFIGSSMGIVFRDGL